MAGNKPTHALLLVTDSGKTKEDGKPISNFTQIAVAWASDSGNLFFDLPKGLLVTGKLMVKEIERRERPLSENGDVDEDLPF